MDNNNNKKSSPLDEIKRITGEATKKRVNTANSNSTNIDAVKQGTVKNDPLTNVVKPSATAKTAEAVKPTVSAKPAETVKPAVSAKPAEVAKPVPNVKPAPIVKKEPLKNDFDITESSVDIDIPDVEAIFKNRASSQKNNDESAKTRVINKNEINQAYENASRKPQQPSVTSYNYNPNPPVKKAEEKPVTQYNYYNKRSAPSEMTEEFEETVGRGVLSNTVKAIIYIVSVFVVSGCLALFAILVGNDCFAFVKSEAQAVITLPENADLNDIADELKDNDIIKYPNMFKLYISLRGKDTGDYIAGNHSVDSTMGYDTLISKFKPTTVKQEITLTIIEGSTTQDIIDLFIENGIGTQEGFEKAMDYDYGYWFLDQLTDEMTADRIYRLDGYLFPDTYNFYTDSSEVDVLNKLLSNFETKFDKENESRAKELGMSVDDIVIMASMIQKEAMYISDYPIVSSVFYNRMNSSVTNGLLQSNATVQYTMPSEEVELELSSEQIQTYDNGYNTFLYEGLPIGPICNSSLNALNWALYPSDTDYYYFVSDADGVNHYATTYQEHLKNVAQYQG